ncbi:MAG: hypothetical protein ABWX92_15440 [Mycetocola sp.]
MTTDVIDQYSVLHILKVKGFASAESVGTGLGVDAEVVQPVLHDAVESELAKHREGRLSGYTLTAAGRERVAQLRQEVLGSAARAELSLAYDSFLAPNRAFKQLTTDWQFREEGSDTAPLLDRLGDIDAQVQSVVEAATAADPRFSQYGIRFTAALERLRAGDDSAFARPMTDSYHDVWMELHEDLLCSLDRERDEADE